MSNWSTGCCKTNGINIHYTITGGNKPPIVLLHGLTANGACWTEVAHDLKSDYDVIMPDARGHGSSSKPVTGYQYEDHADDVVGLIKTMQLPPAIMIGHSMGGMTAALLASQHPDLLCCLILADPTFLSLDVQRQVQESDVVDQHRRYLNMSLDEITADTRIKHPDRSIETIKLMALARLQTSVSAFEILTPPNPDFVQLVTAIENSTLLVISGSAGVVSPEVAENLQRINPRLQVEQIPEAGHGLHYDHPERFTAIVKSFLRTNDSKNKNP